MRNWNPLRHKNCGGAIIIDRGRFRCTSCMQSSVLQEDMELVEKSSPKPRKKNRPDVEHYRGVGRVDSWIRKRSR